MSIIWKWSPNKGLGTFVLGERIDLYQKSHKLTHLSEEGDGTDWDTYQVDGFDIYIDIDLKSRVIESIRSSDFFYYKNQNIIGLTLVELNKLILATSPEKDEVIEFENGYVETSYDYDEFGLQIWTSNDCIVGVICINQNE